VLTPIVDTSEAGCSPLTEQSDTCWLQLAGVSDTTHLVNRRRCRASVYHVSRFSQTRETRRAGESCCRFSPI